LPESALQSISFAQTIYTGNLLLLQSRRHERASPQSYFQAKNALNDGLKAIPSQSINSEKMHYRNCKQEKSFLVGNSVYLLSFDSVKPYALAIQ
jgi:hypothetical protein